MDHSKKEQSRRLAKYIHVKQSVQDQKVSENQEALLHAPDNNSTSNQGSSMGKSGIFGATSAVMAQQQ